MLRLPVSASTGPQSALNLRQPRLAQPIKAVLDILGVLVDGKTFVSFNREPRVDPQHLRGFGSRLLKLSRLGIGGRQHKMRTLLIGQAQYAFAAQTHRLPIALEHVIGQTNVTKRKEEWLKRIEAEACLQCLDPS